MGNWSEQQEAKKEEKERDKVRRENIAKYFLNLSQLSFVTLVLGIMVKFDWGNTAINVFTLSVTIIMGMAFTIIFAVIANKIFK